MTQEEKNELKARFAKGKYPTENDFAALIDSIGGGDNNGFKVFTKSDSSAVYDSEALSTGGFKENDIIIVKNTSSNTITTPISYESGRTVTIAPQDAVMLINKGSYDEWGVVNIPIN